MKTNLQITLIAGNGGNGHISFRREKFVPRGGPDGGNGGNGGNIILIGDENMFDLKHIKDGQLFKSEDGKNGFKRNRNGKNGEDLVIIVPENTLVAVEEEGKEFLLKNKERRMIVEGGKRGQGNKSFKSSTNQEPLLAEAGERGKKVKTTLKLKKIAEIGIIGFTNSGKSTLLNFLTNAKTREASYPFTTMQIVLGTMNYDFKEIKIIEIPDFFNSKKQNHKDFVNHMIELKILIIVVDVESENIKNTVENMLKEIGTIATGIEQVEQIICVSKIDNGEKFEQYKNIVQMFRKNDVFYLSKIQKDGVNVLKKYLIEKIQTIEKPNDNPEIIDPVIHNPKRIGKAINYIFDKRKNIIYMKDEKLMRIALGSDLSRPETQLQFHRLMVKRGYIKKFEEEGVVKGTIIKFNDIEMEFA